MKRIALALILLGANLSSASDTTLPLVGLEKDGTPIQILVSKKQYQEKLGQLISSINDSTLPVLQKRNSSRRWNLRTVLIGITIDLEMGFTPIFKLGLLPRFRVLFSNSTDPAYP